MLVHYGPFIESIFERIHRRHAIPPDRRPRDRPMEVLALGMPRTGTESLRMALKELGYDETYHGYVAIQQVSDYVLWRKAAAGKFEGKGKPYERDDWDRILGNCMAVTDIPAALFATELIEAYPEAKVILSERDPDDWYRSVDKTFNNRTAKNPLVIFLGHFKWELWCLQGITQMWEHFVRGDFERYGKTAYLEHNAMIKKMVPKEKLLVYHVSQGWEPLCQFLGKKVPEKAVPRGNDPEAFFKFMKPAVVPWLLAAVMNALLSVGFGVAVLAAVVALTRRYVF